MSLPSLKRDTSGKVVPNQWGGDPIRARVMNRLSGLSMRAVERMAALMESEDERIAFAAAKEIMDRRLGKPKQEAELKIETVDLTTLHLEALRRMAELTSPKVIDGQTSES